MQAPIRISGIKERAERIGLSLTKLCDEAGHSSSTVYRWLNREHDPRLGHYEAVCNDLDRVLQDREREVLQHLAGLQPAPAERAA